MKGENVSKETHEKEMKRIEHYEMWWNTWERRRGRRSKLEQSIEEKEIIKMRVQWEKENERKENGTHEEIERRKGTGGVTERNGAENIDQYWVELEKVLDNIGMDDIWNEENEPREEKDIIEEKEEPERMRKKARLENEKGGYTTNNDKGVDKVEEKGRVENYEKKGNEPRERDNIENKTNNDHDVRLERKMEKKGKEKPDSAPQSNTPGKKEKGKGLVVVEGTPKGKGKGTGPKLTNQSIKKFLTRKPIMKGTKTDNPVENNTNLGENINGCSGEGGGRNISAKPDYSKPDTENIPNDKSGVEGLLVENIEKQQQQAVRQSASQCVGKFTDSLERRTEKCTEKQRSAGAADSSEYHHQ